MGNLPFMGNRYASGGAFAFKGKKGTARKRPFFQKECTGTRNLVLTDYAFSTNHSIHQAVFTDDLTFS
jgi:hypothetical protein